MTAQFNFDAVIILFICVSSIAGQNLIRCILFGDPHLIGNHYTNAVPRVTADCLNSHNLLVVNNSQVLLRSIVSNTHLMTEFHFEFRSSPNGPVFCTVTSNNFIIVPSLSCTAGGVVAKILENRTTLTVTVTYPPAGLMIVITHLKNIGYRFYEMYIWTDTRIVNLSQDNGACQTNQCPTFSLPVGKRSAQNYINNVTNVSNATAARLCQAYIDGYLSSLQRAPSQRDAHYNRTIENALEACIFDTVTLGAGMAAGVTTSILMEELTTGLDNLTAIENRLDSILDSSLAAANELAMNLSTQVIQILNNTNSQATTTTISSLLTQTTIMTNSTSTMTTSRMQSQVADSGISKLQISLAAWLTTACFLYLHWQTDELTL